ncbi:phosphotransferase [Pseudonocardia sp. 73-21]|uniref:phosphotransferase n=1 Tax=Pseudonocardia sp. 73-21 TaxID=1895809 RepID=UPI0009605DFB|nr:phosphotransferase [Pseudonocardia sp. 73-21]OJY45253.1 MAG: hypothetical protein BGP03_15800 [Pseudonocardia sp. 73-21]
MPRSVLLRLAPVHRDGLALVLSSALTSGVGLLYWVLAARLFPPDVLGINQVAISTMMFLGGIAQLNMTYALLRFVPVAGWAARRVVLGGYVVGAGMAALVGAGFALGARVWAPQLVDEFGPGRLLLFFVVATPLWSIFVIQDYVLTGIRRATVVPGENFVFSLLKILLLLVATVLVVPGGIAVSWAVATALIVVPINVWMLLRAVPQFGRNSAVSFEPVTVSAIARFVRADYAGGVFWQAALFGIPLLVLARLGAGAAAAYAVVWTITQSLYLVASGMSQSMVAHSAGDLDGLDGARRAMVRRAMVLVAPASVVLAVGAPLILSLFGRHYADYGSGALRWTALSAIPNVVTASTVGAARVRRRMGVLFGVPAGISVMVIVLSWELMPVLGITAVGISWLTAQVLMALGILVATAPWLPPGLRTGVDRVRTKALLRRVRPFAAADTRRDGWVMGERLGGGSDTVVVACGPDGGIGGALLKASDSTLGRTHLRRQTDVLRALHTDTRLGAWRRLVPSVLDDGDAGGSYAVIESRLAGRGGGEALRDPARRRRFRSSAVSVISELHRCTATPAVVGDEELRLWVAEPMAQVVRALPRGRRAEAERLAAILTEQLRGRVVSTAWTHGDYTADNVLTAPDGRVVAIVDWCQAQQRGLAVLDVVSFLLTSERELLGSELGAVVLEHLADIRSADNELLARAQRMLGGSVLDVRLLTLLGWLAHVAQNMAKSPSFAANPVWVRRNLVAVVAGALPVLDEQVTAGV